MPLLMELQIGFMKKNLPLYEPLIGVLTVKNWLLFVLTKVKCQNFQ